MDHFLHFFNIDWSWMILSLSSCRGFSSHQWLRPPPFDKSEPHCNWIHSVTDGLISKPTTELGETSSSSWLELRKYLHNQTKMAEENDWKSFSGTHSELKGLPKLYLWTAEKWSGEDSQKRHFGKVARIWRETRAYCLSYIICGHSIISTSKKFYLFHWYSNFYSIYHCSIRSKHHKRQLTMSNFFGGAF